MFLIMEHNGEYVMGFTCKEDGSGDNITFNNKNEAIDYAKENCAFEYQIIEI